MFPNVRLLAGAFVASIVALSCGFALFAAFRVNHEPLSRLPAGTAPVQFVANEAVAPRAGWGTPFDGQSRLNGPLRGEIAADVPAATPAGHIKLEAASAGTDEPIKPIAVATPVIEMVPPRELAQPAEVIEPVVSVTVADDSKAKTGRAPEAAGQISPSDSAAVDATGQAAPSAATLAAGPADGAAGPASVAPDETATVPSSPAASALPSASTASLPDAGSAQPTGAIPTAAAAAPPSRKGAAETEAATPGSAVKQNTDSPAAAPAPAATPVVATATPSDQPTLAAPPAPQTEPKKSVSTPAKAAERPARKIEAKNNGKTVRKPVARRRVIARRRVVRRRRSTGQDGFDNPVFQSAPNFSDAMAFRGGPNSSSW